MAASCLAGRARYSRDPRVTKGQAMFESGGSAYLAEEQHQRTEYRGHAEASHQAAQETMPEPVDHGVGGRTCFHVSSHDHREARRRLESGGPPRARG